MSDYENRGRCQECGAMEGHCCISCPTKAFPEFWEWKQDLTNEKEIDLACQFYRENIGLMQVDISPDNAKTYELAKDAEDFMIDMIRDCSVFVSEWDSFLEERHEEEKEKL